MKKQAIDILNTSKLSSLLTKYNDRSNDTHSELNIFTLISNTYYKEDVNIQITRDHSS